MLGPILFLAVWFGLSFLIVVAFSRNARRRKSIEAQIIRSRAGRADATPDPTSAAVWGEFDRSAR